MTELLVQISMGFFGVLLLIITGLMAWMTKEVIKASGKIGILEKVIESIKESLVIISSDLKITGRHDSEIAVLQSKVDNLESDYTLVSQKIQEIERNAKSSIRR